MTTRLQEMGNANGQKKFKEEEEEDPDEKQAMIVDTNGTTNETWSTPAKRNSQTKYAPLSVSGISTKYRLRTMQVYPLVVCNHWT